jgi:hypothetical protein
MNFSQKLLASKTGWWYIFLSLKGKHVYTNFDLTTRTVDSAPFSFL